jgi:hypothetical protein
MEMLRLVMSLWFQLQRLQFLSSTDRGFLSKLMGTRFVKSRHLLCTIAPSFGEGMNPPVLF